ncbi:hypothetical protein IW261DRAFT_533793 [Armillaria novae-zelandiae]|uniref:ATPase inhibitor, mitochondrial n=1 Tax=Armillaria novae-zelandiae TaxID=153914 RepID=A0AA39P0A2_9AGAR|nr:hypothetical protein IW262DRAFT_1455201 [Armillaria fumosa]KAK0474920.1 hypothetical protein IW261DRAFT_533793 [Armillaria novae-zelandiae]
MSSGATAQDKTWKSKEQAEEAQYAHKKEQEQLAALKEKLEQSKSQERDFEGGFGGQEDLEDRYATTSGEH